MKQETKLLLKKYGISCGIASLITFIIFWIRGFFTDSASVNIQILSDGFSISGMLFLFFAGMMYISGEGALIGIGFVMRTVVQTFVPMGRKNHIPYKEYREMKLGSKKKSGDHCIVITGLVFFVIGLVFTAIWYALYYV